MKTLARTLTESFEQEEGIKNMTAHQKMCWGSMRSKDITATASCGRVVHPNGETVSEYSANTLRCFYATQTATAMFGAEFHSDAQMKGHLKERAEKYAALYKSVTGPSYLVSFLD
jgi:hypothetical protein